MWSKSKFRDKEILTIPDLKTCAVFFEKQRFSTWITLGFFSHKYEVHPQSSFIFGFVLLADFSKKDVKWSWTRWKSSVGESKTWSYCAYLTTVCNMRLGCTWLLPEHDFHYSFAVTSANLKWVSLILYEDREYIVFLEWNTIEVTPSLALMRAYGGESICLKTVLKIN